MSMKLFSTQQKLFDSEKPKDAFVFALDVASNGAKNYGWSKNFQTFWKDYETLQDKNYYELLMSKSLRRPYFDLDIITTDISIKAREAIFDEFVQAYQAFQKKHNIVITNPVDLRVTDSTRTGKISLHIVDISGAWRNNAHTKAFYEKFVQGKVENDQLIDPSVASNNRCMRMLESSKFGQDRPLVRASWHEPSAHSHPKNFFIQNFRSDRKLLDKGIKPEKRPPKVQRPITNKAIPDSDLRTILEGLSQDRVENYGRWIQVGMCLWRHAQEVPEKEAEIKDLWHEFSSRSAKYDFDYCEGVWDRGFTDKDEALTVASLYWWLNQDDPEKAYALRQGQKAEKKNDFVASENVALKDNIETITTFDRVQEFSAFDCTVINKEFLKLKHIPTAEKSSVIVVSPTGTGKTTLMQSVINVVGGIWVAIVTRRSLALKLENDYGFKNYRKISGPIDVNETPRIIISVESSWRIVDNFKGLKISLLIDEFGGLWPQTIAETIRDCHASECVRIIKNLLRHACRSYFLDATATKADLYHLAVWAPRIKQKVILNTFKSSYDEGSVCYAYDTKKAWQNVLVGAIENGEKVVISCVTKTSAEKYANLIRHMWEKSGSGKLLGLFTSDTAQSVKQELADVNKTWKKYSAIVYTSTVGRGISFDKHNHFGKYFADFSNTGIITPEEAFQSIRRVRKTITGESHVLFPKTVWTGSVVSVKSFIDGITKQSYIQKNRLTPFKGRYDHLDTGEYNYPHKDFFWWSWIWLQHRKVNTKFTFSADVIGLIKSYGIFVENKCGDGKLSKAKLAELARLESRANGKASALKMTEIKEGLGHAPHFYAGILDKVRAGGIENLTAEEMKTHAIAKLIVFFKIPEEQIDDSIIKDLNNERTLNEWFRIKELLGSYDRDPEKYVVEKLEEENLHVGEFLDDRKIHWKSFTKNPVALKIAMTHLLLKELGFGKITDFDTKVEKLQFDSEWIKGNFRFISWLFNRRALGGKEDISEWESLRCNTWLAGKIKCLGLRITSDRTQSRIDGKVVSRQSNYKISVSPALSAPYKLLKNVE